jgi:hypothetical protein
MCSSLQPGVARGGRIGANAQKKQYRLKPMAALRDDEVLAVI